MNDWVSLGLGSVAGALVSEGLKVLIKEAKNVLVFDSVSKELTSTMKSLLPIITQIEMIQDVGELKDLKDTIIEAVLVVRECSSVKKWDLFLKSKYSKKIKKINEKMLKFCQVQLHVLQFKNQLQSNEYLQIIMKMLDRLSVSPPINRYLCSVPKLDTVPVGFDCPLMKLKTKLLTDSVDSLVVYAPPRCGMTTLVTQLCYDEEIKGKFKHIFFMIVSSAPDFRVLVHNLLQENGYRVLTFENDFQAAAGLRNLHEELSKNSPIFRRVESMSSVQDISEEITISMIEVRLYNEVVIGTYKQQISQTRIVS